MLRHRRLLPDLHHSNQRVNTVHITPTERIDPGGLRAHRGNASHWRILGSSSDKGSFRPAHSSGEVERGFKFFVKSTWVNATGKSFLRANLIRARRTHPGPPISRIGSPILSSITDRIHCNPEYRQYVWRAPRRRPPISGRFSIGAEQTMKPRREGPHWTATPRSSPNTCAGADESQLGHCWGHTRVPAASKPGDHPLEVHQHGARR